MVTHAFKESFRLIGRSKGECLIYLAAVIVGELFMVWICKRFGFNYPPEYFKLAPVEIAYVVAFSIPAFMLTLWFCTGLMGRLSMDAVKGAPDSLVKYANGWFVRNMTGSLIIAAASFMPVIFFMLLMKGFAMLLSIVWLPIFIWFIIRISMWVAAMFIEDLGAVAAIKHAYNVSGKYFFDLFLLCLPMFVGGFVAIGIARFAQEHIYFSRTLHSLLVGSLTIVQMGAVAAMYLTIKRELAAGEAKVQP